MTQQPQTGFTLVELAIALMVIGLLIGGVLKGQELIGNSRITRAMKDFHDYDTATLIFRSTYNGLPGDIRNPERLPNCDTLPCNSIIGVGTGIYPAPSIKSMNFWRHLERAKLIIGINEDGDAITIAPPTPINNHMYIVTISPSQITPAPTDSPIRTYLNLNNGNGPGGTANPNQIPCAYVAALDRKMDDGKPYTGEVQLLHNNIQCLDSDGDYINTKTITTIGTLVHLPSAE